MTGCRRSNSLLLPTFDNLSEGWEDHLKGQLRTKQVATITVSLPESLRKYIEDRASAQGYRTVGDYVSHLVEEEQRRETQNRLDSLLQEGIDSGEPQEVGAAYWDRKRRGLAARLVTTTTRPLASPEASQSPPRPFPSAGREPLK